MMFTKAVAGVAVCLGVASALLLAGPASASDTPGPSPDPAQSAAYQQLRHTTVTESTESGTPSVTGGHELTIQHGGPLLWTATTWDWYWTGSKMSSSTATQTLGYVFPNTATKGGAKRTLTTSGQHNWTSTMVAGVGVPTPWGSIDVYRQTMVDKVSLFPGGTHKTY